MFERENLKWTVGVLAVGGVCVVGLVLVALWRAASAQEAVTLSGLIGAMQQRAEGLTGLSGMLGEQMTVPVQGPWSGVPFKFRGPASYVQLEGHRRSSPEEPPEETENAWILFWDGVLYHREGRRTERLDISLASGGDPVWEGPEVLLVVNLMPQAWFGSLSEHLRLGEPEEVAGKTYYTILEVEELPAPRERLIRYPVLHRWTPREPRKYYVNPGTYVCERMVQGRSGQEDPFAGAVTDVVAEDIQQLGGRLLPMRYTKRFYTPKGVYLAVEMRLEGLEVKAASALPQEDFDPYALTPGPVPVVMRPGTEMEELEALAEQGTRDAGAWLSLARAYVTTRRFREAREVLEKASALFGEGAGEEFSAQKARIAEEVDLGIAREDVEQSSQLERIFAERAERFRQRGDEKHAAEMASRSERHREIREAALAKLKELGVKE